MEPKLKHSRNLQSSLLKIKRFLFQFRTSFYPIKLNSRESPPFLLKAVFGSISFHEHETFLFIFIMFTLV